MLRIYLPIAFAVLFILWVLFQLIVKRDLKKHLNTVYLGLFFGVVWAVIYFFVLTPAPVETAEKVDRTKELKKQIEQILADKKAVVGISISGENGNDTLSINGNMHCPTQSAYKMHIGLAMLDKIDRGEFSLDQKIKISKDDLPVDAYWNPLGTDFPDGGDLTVAQLIQYCISHSDNTACDTLIGMVGSPKDVESFFKKNNIQDLQFEYNERTMQSKWENMFQNWITPNAAVQTLRLFYENKNSLLSNSSYNFFWQTMKETSTGVKRLKGLLPEGTVVAHKTGSSGTNDAGLTAATNDWGVVFLPNGHYFIISVLVTNSYESDETNERIIAEVCTMAYDFFLKR
ncbi:MAG: class A beta-lactamase, subclass A2 [Flavobacteriales bacterium]|nr:class A beta-lactamase, subclass A2 [Flavobacteriales bacterium]